MLTTDEPNVEFTLALGADTFIDLVNGKWRRSEDVLKLVEYRIVVFRRFIEEGNDDDVSSSASDELKQYDEVQRCIAKLRLRVDSTTTEPAITVTQIPTATKSNIGVSVSSSAARNTTDETVLRQILSADVLDYIRERKMYAFAG
jgi:nicotinic acid mononucleotide adenylyltransferase